ncbi:MAG: hypothetical protein BWK76_18415 [Desulfobulbaceae bacterium A2]|nr:MAG: hypothetical protein BWK76_18415 [Desulfobulbaceae bacterium A2]
MAPQVAAADLLARAGRLTGLLGLVFLLASLFLAGDLLRGRAALLAPAQTLVRLLALDELSLIPSGRPGRSPAIAHPAVDTRHSPFAPRWAGGCVGAGLPLCRDQLPAAAP